jgi:hypothetical protein
MSLSLHHDASHCYLSITGLRVCIGLLFHVGKRMNVYQNTAICKYQNEPLITYMQDWEANFMKASENMVLDLTDKEEPITLAVDF